MAEDDEPDDDDPDHLEYAETERQVAEEDKFALAYMKLAGDLAAETEGPAAEEDDLTWWRRRALAYLVGTDTNRAQGAYLKQA